MSYINQLTLGELDLNSESWGATSNCSITTDATGDINLNPLTGGAVYANNNLITTQIQFGSSTGPTMSCDIGGNAVYTPNTFITPTIQFDSTSGPIIITDTSGNIDFYPVSGTMNIYGGSTQTLASADNLTIECGSSSSITLAGNTSVGNSTTSSTLTITGSTTLSSASVSGSTTLGTNSTAISNIQFGVYTFSSVKVASADSTNYTAGTTIKYI
jgi:hypothetical protein